MFKEKYNCPDCGKEEISTEEMQKIKMGFFLCGKCECLWSIADSHEYYFEVKKRKNES